jgi:hypothetical protein
LRVSTPHAPGAAPNDGAEIEVFEWLDRPGSRRDHRPLRAAQLPKVLATLTISRHSLRLSSPRAGTLQRIEEALFPRLEGGSRSIRREASPLPLPFLDAALWTFRVPPGVDSDVADQLRRESVEQYFENEWVHHPRHGLDGQSPLLAAREARGGNAAARAKLTAVVRFREQLGSRKSALGLYQGYPFDRLRRRLGLELVGPAAVDPEDLSCAGPEELERLDPSALANLRLLDAIESAAGLRDDARTARLASELVGRQPREIPPLELTAVVSPLVRQAMSRNDYDGALTWIEHARPMFSGETEATLDVWRAEILARAGRPESALPIYLRLIKPGSATGAALALDAAETMLDNGHLDQAESLLISARDLARTTGQRWIERRVQQMTTRPAT